MIENFRDDLVNTRTRATAKKALGGLSMILEECVRRGLVARNVAKGVQIKKQRGKKLPVIPNKAELRAFLNAADACANPMLRTFAYLLVFSGLRASEVRGLPWRSINFNSGTITIYQRADRKNKIGATKTDAGLRTIPLPPSVLNALRKWQPHCPASAAELVFPSKRATPIFHPNLVLWLLDPLQIAAKLTKQGRKQGKQVTRGKYGMHSFRHAAASLWIERHVDSKRIQTWMGHSSIQVTFDTYGHLFEQAHSDAAIILEIERDLLSPCDNDATNELAD
jgi:integrase